MDKLIGILTETPLAMLAEPRYFVMIGIGLLQNVYQRSR